MSSRWFGFRASGSGFEVESFAVVLTLLSKVAWFRRLLESSASITCSRHYRQTRYLERDVRMTRAEFPRPPFNAEARKLDLMILTCR